MAKIAFLLLIDVTRWGSTGAFTGECVIGSLIIAGLRRNAVGECDFTISLRAVKYVIRIVLQIDVAIGSNVIHTNECRRYRYVEVTAVRENDTIVRIIVPIARGRKIDARGVVVAAVIGPVGVIRRIRY